MQFDDGLTYMLSAAGRSIMQADQTIPALAQERDLANQRVAELEGEVARLRARVAELEDAVVFGRNLAVHEDDPEYLPETLDSIVRGPDAGVPETAFTAQEDPGEIPTPARRSRRSTKDTDS